MRVKRFAHLNACISFTPLVLMSGLPRVRVAAQFVKLFSQRKRSMERSDCKNRMESITEIPLSRFEIKFGVLIFTLLI